MQVHVYTHNCNFNYGIWNIILDVSFFRPLSSLQLRHFFTTQHNTTQIIYSFAFIAVLHIHRSCPPITYVFFSNQCACTCGTWRESEFQSFPKQWQSQSLRATFCGSICTKSSGGGGGGGRLIPCAWSASGWDGQNRHKKSAWRGGGHGAPWTHVSYQSLIITDGW